jgi:hypothetical protein
MRYAEQALIVIITCLCITGVALFAYKFVPRTHRHTTWLHNTNQNDVYLKILDGDVERLTEKDYLIQLQINDMTIQVTSDYTRFRYHNQ